MLVDLLAVSSDFEGEIVVSALEHAGIPARVFSAVGRTLGPVAGQAMPIRVQVRRQDLERARKALRSTREESVDLDWDQVDVGQRVDDADDRHNLVVARLAVIILLLMIVFVMLALLRSAVWP